MRFLLTIDEMISRLGVLGEAYVPVRALPTVLRYRRLREEYYSLTLSKGSFYHEQDIRPLVRDKLRKRGYTPRSIAVGSIHTLAFLPRESWHDELYDDLRILGPVSEFDYVEHGYRLHEFLGSSSKSNERRREMNERFFSFACKVHREQPVDWMFMYATGSEISPQILSKMQETLGFPIVGMCFDDKHSWKGPQLDGYRGLQIDIAPILDLAWTSATVTTEWYRSLGGIAIYLPEGTNPRVYRQLMTPKDIPVSFVGARYGFRPMRIRQLQRYGVNVHCVGRGWANGYASKAEVVAVYNRTLINLGMGGINFSEWLTNVKGRDFDIPCTGSFYLTSYNADLARHFRIGKEIMCYANADELVELVRYYLAHPDEAAAIGRAGRERCLAEHTWFHRYKRICGVLGILQDGHNGH